MSGPEPVYRRFIGLWRLDPALCDYEQGEAPRSGDYRIVDDDGTLEFHMRWTDAEGTDHEVSFSGVPDGVPTPFAGGPLADELSITAVSPRELNSSAYYKGSECMVAQRQLDDTGMAMRVVQVVRFPDGTSLVNISVYRRVLSN